jgi:tetratricopeptide (TPR) repeat protein
MRCPYKGLLPFTEEDQEFFAGRAKEIDLVISNLYASPLTILYGESGVGKTSLIVAGVLPELEKEEHRVAAILFREWQSPDFELKLRQEILKSLLKTINRLRLQSDPQSSPLLFDSFLETFRLGLKFDTVEQLYALRLDEFIKQCCQAFYGRLFFIFDQFEEYIYYHPLSEDGKRFDEQLAVAINDRSVPAGFLVSLREDGLGKLDRLRGGIPDLLGNVIRLEHLDRNGAEEAIRKPLRIFNQHSPVKVEVTDDFTATLLRQADADRLEWDEPVDGAEGELPRSDRGVRYRALALQAVLTRVWDGYVAPNFDRAHQKNGTIHISEAALKHVAHKVGKNGRKRDKEDEVRSIVRTYFDEWLGRLDQTSQKNAAEILPHMVRAGGQKKAQLVKTLARISGISEVGVQATIDKLRTEPLNLVKEVPSKGGALYELHHDVMAFAVQDWSRRKQREIRERRQLWIWSGGTALLFAVLSIIAWGVWNHLSSQQMEMREQIAVVEQHLAKIANYSGISEDPLIGKAGLLAAIDLYAWSRKQGMPISEGILIPLYLAPERRDESTPLGAKKAKLRRSAVAAEIPALTVPGGRFTLTIEDNNTPVFFDRDKGKVERLAPLDSPIIQIGFSKEFTRVGVGCQDGSSVVWDIGNLKRNTKTNQPLQTALGLADVSEESRQKLLKTSSAEKLWQAGCTELGNEWLLRALSTVTRSPEDYREFYQPRNDAGKALTQTFHEAIQLAGANKAEEAISLLTQELSRLGFKTQGEMQAQARAQLKNVLVSSALNRVMEEFQNLRLEMDSVDPANLKAEFEPRNEKLVLALDPSFKDKIDAQKEIHRGNVLASQGDAAGAIQAYQKAKGLDPALQDLKPEEQVKQFVRSLGTGESSREAAIQKINFGNEAALRGELDRAIALYREAIALDSQLAKSLDPEAEARKWNERRNAPMKTPAPGRTPPEATQIRE